MSTGWEFHTSQNVARFLARLPVREEARVLRIFEEIVRHPVLGRDDAPVVDQKGRMQWLRFRDGFVITFWWDHAEKHVRVSEIGRD